MTRTGKIQSAPHRRGKSRKEPEKRDGKVTSGVAGMTPGAWETALHCCPLRLSASGLALSFFPLKMINGRSDSSNQSGHCD